MRLKRKPVCDIDGNKVGIEPWLDWQIRSMSRAGAETLAIHIDAIYFLTKERLSWAGHVSRFGLDDKPPHISKYLVAWRSVAWWRIQQTFNNAGSSVLRNAFPFLPRRWEDGLPTDWLNQLSS